MTGFDQLPALLAMLPAIPAGDFVQSGWLCTPGVCPSCSASVLVVSRECDTQGGTFQPLQTGIAPALHVCP